MASGLSKYAEKLALRRRDSNGRMFQPLTDNGVATPMPHPFSFDYHPKHECVISCAKDDLGKLLPHELKNRKQIEFFRVPHKAY
jgi:hypothetical protein